jgi:DNA primase
MKNTVIAPEMVRERLEAAFYALDIPAEIERHTNTRLHSVTRGKQYGGACPFEDCSVDSDGFSVWPELTSRGRHYYCRGCQRSGDIVKLVQDIKGLGFSDACKELGIPNPYLDDQDSTAVSRTPARRAVKAEQWQLDELQYLNNVYPRTKLALQRDRARAYLAERSIPFELADAQGLGYIPALSEVSHVTPEIERFRRWCDRIIFPILTPKGDRGYCGRTLFLWEPGMDEDEHKAKLDTYNLQMKEQYGEKARWHQMPRWKYTYQHAFFNWQVMKEATCPVFVEGPFDALACLASGVHNAISIGTTGIDAGMLPISVCSAIMGLDIDGPGRKAAKQLATGLRRKGIDVQVCTPMDGKDWSAAYRVHGMQGLAPLIQAIAVAESQSVFDSLPEKCRDCGTHITDDGRKFFYWPISTDAALCFCTLCQDMSIYAQ